jgi:hypothetical protein
MKRSFSCRTLNAVWAMLLLAISAAAAMAQTSTLTVDCTNGQSLNHALSTLNKQVPATVSVKGICTEFVQVADFNNLTLTGLPGAALALPSTGPGDLTNAVLYIQASRSVTVSGFSIEGTPTLSAVTIAHGSSDIRLQSLHIRGGAISVIEHSQALVAHVAGQDAGYALLGVFDSSDVHVEHCQFLDTTGTQQWHSGIFVGASHITMFDTTIRNMTVGIDGAAGSIIDIVTYNTYTPLGGHSDVVIDSPDGTNYQGVFLDSGSSLNVTSARLLINQAGQSWGGNTGGILVSDGSTLTSVAPFLVISNSLGQGILVENNSHATLVGAGVTGSGHGGLVLANLSSVDVSSGTTLTVIGSNGVDLFCDSSSRITGSGNLAGKPSSQCTNVLPSEAILP